MNFKLFINKTWEKSQLKKGEFAGKIGVSNQMLSKYLSGESSPSFDRACGIIKELGYKMNIVMPLDDKDYFDVDV